MEVKMTIKEKSTMQLTDRAISFTDSNRTTNQPPVYNEQGITRTENPFDRINSDHAKIIWMLTELMEQRNAPVQKSDLMDINEASELLKISKSSIYKLTMNCGIPFIKRGGSKKLIFSRIDLDTWVKESQTPKVNLVEKHLHMNLRVRKVQNN